MSASVRANALTCSLSYVIGIGSVAHLFFSGRVFSIIEGALVPVSFISVIIGLLFCSVIFWNSGFQVAIRASSLGVVFGIGLLLIFKTSSACYFGVYLVVLSLFHVSEYLVTALSVPHTLSLDSFLINHSFEYGLAAALSWTEYLVEWWFFPGMKQLWFISAIGFVLCLFGDVLRKSAIITAGMNFNHVVQYHKDPNHKLVTNGVYSFSRHPSYVGWFYWSVATQIVLCNPFCATGFCIASWRFFRDRVQYEETLLVSFFGQEYIDYTRRVPTRLPFIPGLKPNE